MNTLMDKYSYNKTQAQLFQDQVNSENKNNIEEDIIDKVAKRQNNHENEILKTKLNELKELKKKKRNGLI